VIAALDALLEPYGAPGAYGRDEQISDAFISSEIDQLRTMGSVLPPIFLLVAAFLVNVVISRLIATQRTEIGLMKAFGYSDGAVVAHYMKLVGMSARSALRSAAARHLARARWPSSTRTTITFPLFLVFEADPRVYATSSAITPAQSAAARLRGAPGGEPRTRDRDDRRRRRRTIPESARRARDERLDAARSADADDPASDRALSVARGVHDAGVAVSGALLIGTTFFIDSMDEMIASTSTSRIVTTCRSASSSRARVGLLRAAARARRAGRRAVSDRRARACVTAISRSAPA
jgi:putative ABC transport system permease protein